MIIELKQTLKRKVFSNIYVNLAPCLDKKKRQTDNLKRKSNTFVKVYRPKCVLVLFVLPKTVRWFVKSVVLPVLLIGIPKNQTVRIIFSFALLRQILFPGLVAWNGPHYC